MVGVEQEQFLTFGASRLPEMAVSEYLYRKKHSINRKYLNNINT